MGGEEGNLSIRLSFPLDDGARQIKLPLSDSDPAINQQSDHDLEKYTGNYETAYHSAWDIVGV